VGNKPRGGSQNQNLRQRGEDGKQKVDNQGQQEGAAVVGEAKISNVTCFNCAEWGHYSTNCKKLNVRFICRTANQVGRECAEWLKPLELVQYLGNATQGLGFFHVDVQEETTRGWVS
jgi:hypothetical protein